MVDGEFSWQRSLRGVESTVVGVLVLDRGLVAQGGVQPAFVVPVHPVEGGQFQVVDAAPGTFPPDAFGLV